MTSIEMKGAAMSELYKAMKRIEDYQSTKPLYKQIAEIKGIASTARYGYDIQPQLTIPKSIADKLDDIFNEFVRERDSRSIWELLWRAEEIDYEIGYQLEVLLPDENQVNIAIAYLAGKALGVDLVKVEG